MPSGIYVRTKPNPMRGKRHSEKSKKKESEAKKGHFVSEKTREKIRKTLWKGGEREWRRRQRAKRRNLDFIPLNEFFDGAEAHHLDKIYIIHIPKNIHHSIWHNQYTGQGMDGINALAFNYL